MREREYVFSIFISFFPIFVFLIITRFFPSLALAFCFCCVVTCVSKSRRGVPPISTFPTSRFPRAAGTRPAITFRSDDFPLTRSKKQKNARTIGGRIKLTAKAIGTSKITRKREGWSSSFLHDRLFACLACLIYLAPACVAWP